MGKRKILIDCDPGHDDAVALMMAGSSEKFDILGITVEAGNQTIEKTGLNVLHLVEYLNLDVPVALGRGYPLNRTPMNCAEIHGESGLDGFEFPVPKKKFENIDAVEFLYEVLSKNEHVTLVLTGPVTNIGLLLTKYPEIKTNIDEIVLMGGSMGHGNVTPAAEFNILCDPEAAEIVFNSGLVVKMIGLDVTRKVLLYPSILERMNSIGNKVSDLFYKLMKFFNKTQKEIFGFEGAPLHDPATILYLINPNIIKFQFMNTVIDVSHGPSYGRTNCDRFDFLKQKPNAYVAIDIDVDLYWDEIEKGLRKYSSKK